MRPVAASRLCAVAATWVVVGCASPVGPPPQPPAADAADSKSGPRAGAGDEQLARATAPSADWPMFRGNARLTGVAAGSLPEKLELLWTYQTGEKNDAIESSAAIAGGVVYVGSWSGFVHALDLGDGRPRWKYSTVIEPTATAAGDGRDQPPAAGNELPPAVKSSPAVADGRVFFGDEVGVFHAVDAATGRRLWKYETLGEIISSANVVGDRVLFGSSDGSLYCLNTADGKLLWEFKTDNMVQCTPAVADGKTFISGCDGQLRVIDIASGQEVASVDMEGQTGASPAVLDDRLFVGQFSNQVLGIEWKKPEILWRFEHPERHFPFYSSPAATREIVIVGGRDKFVYGLDPNTGQSKWTFATKGRVDSSPVIVDNRVFVGSHDGNLYAIDVATGTELWRFVTGAPISASPAVADGRLVIGNEDGKGFCFGTKSETR